MLCRVVFALSSSQVDPIRKLKKARFATQYKLAAQEADESSIAARGDIGNDKEFRTTIL